MFQRAVALFASTLLVVACSQPKPPLKVNSVTVTAADGTAFMSLGVTRQLVAVADTNRGTQQEASLFTWASSAPNIVSVDATGLVTSVGNGKATITATMDGVSGTLEFTVNQATTGLTISPTQATIVAGTTQQFTATATDAAGHTASTANVIWSVGLAAVATVDARGLVTGRAAGSTTVTATMGPLTATAQLDVSPATPVSVTVSGTETLSAIEGTTQLMAQAFDDHSQVIPDATITWSSANEAVATVDASGLVTAVANGTAEIAAHAGSASGHLTVTVQQVVTSVAVAPAGLTVRPERTVNFSAVAKDANGHVVASAPAATWQSSEPSAVIIDTNGVASTLSVTSIANVTITATVGTVSGTTTLTVDPGFIEVGSVTISGGDVTLSAIDDTLQLSAEVRDVSNVIVTGLTVGWSSSDNTVATVDGNGLVTAVANGTATITASAGGRSSTTTITVEQEVDSVSVTTANAGESLTLASLGETRQLAAHALDANGHAVAGLTFAWASSDGAVSVDADGLATAVENGSATISATVDGISGDLTLTVDQQVAIVTVAAPHLPVLLTSLGDSVQLQATAADARGNVMSDVFTWASMDENTATVDSTGLVTGQANGITVVRASATNGASGGLAITVAQNIASVEVSAGGDTTLTTIGATVQLTARARDARGSLIPAAVISWSSSSSAVASVDTAGLVTAVAMGTATITATGGGQQDSIGITVGWPIVTVSPNSVVLPATIGSETAATSAFSAVLRDAGGTVVPGVSFAWGISDLALGGINMTSGLFTVGQAQTGGFAGASTTVTATGNTISGTAQLFVAAHLTWSFSNSGTAGSPFNVGTVNQGQYVVFRNGDNGVPHSIVWDTVGPSNVGTFTGPADSTSFSAALPPGEYKFHCSIHSSMHGKITVQ